MTSNASAIIERYARAEAATNAKEAKAHLEYMLSMLDKGHYAHADEAYQLALDAMYSSASCMMDLRTAQNIIDASEK